MRNRSTVQATRPPLAHLHVSGDFVKALAMKVVATDELRLIVRQRVDRSLNKRVELGLPEELFRVRVFDGDGLIILLRSNRVDRPQRHCGRHRRGSFSVFLSHARHSATLLWTKGLLGHGLALLRGGFEKAEPLVGPPRKTHRAYGVHNGPADVEVCIRFERNVSARLEPTRRLKQTEATMPNKVLELDGSTERSRKLPRYLIDNR